MYLDLSSYLLRKHFSRPVGYSQVFLQLCSQSMVRVYLDPLVNLTSVASILWVAGRCYGVVILVSAEKVETGRTLHGSIAVTRAFSSTKIRFLEEMVRTLTVVAIVLNLMSNAMKFFDSRYLWSFTFPSFVFLQVNPARLFHLLLGAVGAMLIDEEGPQLYGPGNMVEPNWHYRMGDKGNLY
ncbi:hypothetical protein Y032_0042g662 [Ancylostoma ceylanicum]|uniref:Uncharacterized protein n=1 Tax=Ancylostoma ceylanicum TaxID=53326 RepID=A0A016UFU6_9BILA|nr:hypothetical protein Y032_0042g662 [Ancylostoma ceylanicum]